MIFIRRESGDWEKLSKLHKFAWVASKPVVVPMTAGQSHVHSLHLLPPCLQVWASQRWGQGWSWLHPPVLLATPTPWGLGPLPLRPLWMNCPSTPAAEGPSRCLDSCLRQPSIAVTLVRTHSRVINHYPRPHAISTPSPLGSPCPSGHQAPVLPAADRMGSSSAGVFFEGECGGRLGACNAGSCSQGRSTCK